MADVTQQLLIAIARSVDGWNDDGGREPDSGYAEREQQWTDLRWADAEFDDAFNRRGDV